jgi:hypothetical protein
MDTGLNKIPAAIAEQSSQPESIPSVILNRQVKEQEDSFIPSHRFLSQKIIRLSS